MDPNSGRLIQFPTPEHIAEKGLVPAPHASRSQLHHRHIKPGERCPCGSGKRFKKCCRHVSRLP